MGNAAIATCMHTIAVCWDCPVEWYRENNRNDSTKTELLDASEGEETLIWSK